jgi:hypothetical protein
MTLRDAMKAVFGVGFLLFAADSCAASPLPGGGALRDRAGGYELTVLIEGVPSRTYHHAGETFVLGQLGARYTLRVSNHTGRRIEAVVSVDGRDVIDGRPGDFRSKRGYLVPAWGSVDIEGWRISHAQAAAFRFSSVPDSYAARTGSAREVGVVGVAIFPERYVPPPVYRRPYAVPGPTPPYYPRDDYRRDRSYDEAPSAEGSAARPAPHSPPPASKPAAPSADAEIGRAPGGGARAEATPPRHRPGLGTEYGESVNSQIYEVEFVRANAYRPSTFLGVRYNDRDGLLAMGVPLDRDPMYCGWDDGDLRRTADPFPATGGRFAAPPPGWRRACDWR